MRTEPMATYRPPNCFVCGRASFLELPAYVAAALSTGAPAKQVLPQGSRAGREQLISGTHPVCWAATFGDAEGD